jgi:hypothetical protein
MHEIALGFRQAHAAKSGNCYRGSQGTVLDRAMPNQGNQTNYARDRPLVWSLTSLF